MGLKWGHSWKGFILALNVILIGVLNLKKKVISCEKYEELKERRELKRYFINDVLFNSRRDDEDCWDYKDTASVLYNNIVECWDFYFGKEEMSLSRMVMTAQGHFWNLGVHLFKD